MVSAKKNRRSKKTPGKTSNKMERRDKENSRADLDAKGSMPLRVEKMLWPAATVGDLKDGSFKVFKVLSVISCNVAVGTVHPSSTANFKMFIFENFSPPCIQLEE